MLGYDIIFRDCLITILDWRFKKYEIIMDMKNWKIRT